MKAEDIALDIANAPLTLEEKLSWHFANFDPAVPESMIPVSVEAINLANTSGDLSTLLELPEGSTYFGEQTAPAKDIIEGHHLHYFVTAGTNE
jgi:hypothetical protein